MGTKDGVVVGMQEDSQSARLCGFYKNITYDLPENGAFPYYFIEGLLHLKVKSNGKISIYGIQMGSTPKNVPIPSTRFPPEINKIVISDMNAWGQRIQISCTKKDASTLSCFIS